MIRVCIFDLDGTLLNTEKNIAYNVNLTLQEFGFLPLPVETIRSFVGDGAFLLMKRVLATFGEVNDETFARVFSAFLLHYEESPMHLAFPYDGIMEMLQNLLSCGVRLALFTNKPMKAALPIVTNLFPNVFSEVLGATEDLPLKPSPEGVLRILKSLEVAPWEVLYLGDSGVDMMTAKNASVKAIGCTWGFRSREELLSSGADRVIDSPLELIDILEDKNESGKN